MAGMKAHTEYLSFHTDERYEMVHMTPQVEEIVRRSGIDDGLCFVSPMHITAAIYVNDNEDGLIEDIGEWLEKLAPRWPGYKHHQTASIMYNKPFGNTNSEGMRSGNWSSTLVWGRTLSGHSKENSYLAESLLKFANNNYLWTRIENAGRSSELLITPGSPLPPNFEEEPIGHVQAYTFGYDRDFRVAPHLLAAPGAQFTSYTAPDTLIPAYGHHPFGVVVFVRLRLH